MDGRYRENVVIGQQVDVVKKQDQGTGHLTDGVVDRILTKSAYHPHGIKVRLASGVVGRIKKIYNK
ncbi:MAG: YwbE family protein [Spirochaetia bacterium]